MLLFTTFVIHLDIIYIQPVQFSPVTYVGWTSEICVFELASNEFYKTNLEFSLSRMLLDYRSDLILLSYCACRKYVKRDLIIWSEREGKIWNSVCCNKGVEPIEGGRNCVCFPSSLYSSHATKYENWQPLLTCPPLHTCTAAAVYTTSPPHHLLHRVSLYIKVYNI
jgi:hypothetical protein